MSADLAVRAARAELERDEALEQLRLCREALGAWTSQDKEKLLDTLHIMGIPARDLADIFRLEQDWRRFGGSEAFLERLREQEKLRDRCERQAAVIHFLDAFPGKCTSEVAWEAVNRGWRPEKAPA